MNNLKLYISPSDYNIRAGAEWPSYDDFLAGRTVNNSVIQKELDDYINEAVSTGIKFPIDTATACQSKWTWSTIWLNQLSSSSCHRVDPVPFAINEFDNFHNLPKKLNDRKLMLEGKWPQGGCEYCKKIEDAGGHSDRHHNLNIRGLTPPELETDPVAIKVTPRIVEIFAQNTCNLACLYCNSNLSSRIEQENNKFGSFRSGNVILEPKKIPEATTDYYARFKSWLSDNIQQLNRLHLLGGETFLQKDLITSVLDILEQYPSPDLQLNIFSNFNVPDKLWNIYNNRIKDLQRAGNIKIFDLTASIDCWGPEAEFVRSGLNLAEFEEKFAWASEQDNWMRLNVNQTVTAMTIRTMPDLIKKINQYSQKKHIGHYFEFCTNPERIQHPENYSYDFWESDFDRIFKAMSSETVHQQEVIPRMQGLQKQLQQTTQHNRQQIDQLKIYLDEIDRRRNTNWRDLFSYLDI